VALRDYTSLFQHFLIRAFLLVLGPVGFIYAMLYLRILFWPFLFACFAVAYLLAEHFANTKQRRRWKFWEPRKKTSLERR
jgi:hypothetical protein